MTTDEAIKLVEKHLAAHQPQGYQLRIVPEASRSDDDWWYICVQPDQENIRRYDYYNILAEIERELEDEENVNITLVPVASGTI